MTVTPENPYTKMQKALYDQEADQWTPNFRDPVVGAFDAHNEWPDYDLLFDGINTEDMVALDYGCGPGRMQVKYKDRFHCIHGADISERNIVNALTWRTRNGVEPPHILFQTNGVDLHEVKDDYYDLVFSVICLQHIPVHSIRFQLMKEFYRVLQPGGWFTAQMGYGKNDDPRGRDYYADEWDALVTNGGCDVQVADTVQLETDLTAIGFTDCLFRVRHTGPNDWHAGWVWFRGRKP